MSKLSTACHLRSKMSSDSLVLLCPCDIESRYVQICSAALTLSHTGHWKFQHGTAWQELSEDLKRHSVALHEDGQGYKKIANTLKLCCSTVSKIILRFISAGSTQNRLRVGRPKKLSARAERYIQMLSLKDWRGSAVSIAAEIEEVRGQPVSAHAICRTLHQIGVYRTSPQEEASSENDTQESLQTVYWRHINKAHGLLKPCPMV